MAKRMFNDDEKKLAEGRLVGLDADEVHLRFLIKYNELMVNEGLEQNYLAQLRATKIVLKTDKEELVMKEATIKTLKDQLENGVEEIKVDEAKDA